MLLSRLRPAKKSKDEVEKKKVEGIKELEEFLDKRDYAGAMSLLEHRRKTEDTDAATSLWLAHCAFHAGDYRKASEVYELMLSQRDYPQDIYSYLGCCFFFLGMYDDARKAAERSPKSSLQNRLLFHVAHRLNDEKKLMFHHSQLKDTIEDQLCLASVHYLRSHYQQAIDIYKKILVKHKNFIALNVYLALCYYKLDYYDVSMEVLQPYLEQHPDSPIGVNLKACNHYRLYNSRAAENELKALKYLVNSELAFAKDIVLHNTVVFRNGDAALQVLPSLVDIIPEARSNLIIFHLKKDDVEAAFKLVSNLEPQSTPDFLLKAVAYTSMGYIQSSKEYLKTAAEFYKIVGSSASECDTITGRQSMASAYFLWRQFEDVLVYLSSIKAYFPNDDVFNFNYGQTLLFCENYEEAEATLLLVTGHQITSLLTYQLCLLRAYIKNKKGKQAWNFYQKERNSRESPTILKLVANDCYREEEFLYAAKAFEEMEKKESRMNYSSAKQGAVVGVVKMFAIGRVSIEDLRDALRILERDRHPHSANIVAVSRKWAAEVNVYI
uniref:Intraflagellar transport protein 56 n=1 Tax=Acrobeloides nanus TaxID=290746 RepID=A0A914C3E8_9BILA